MPKRRIQSSQAPSSSYSPALKRRCGEDGAEKKKLTERKRVAFAGVTAFYFPRQQGFCSVPSSGGTALGMGWEHEGVRTFSLAEHRAERRAETNRRMMEEEDSKKVDVNNHVEDDEDSDSSDGLHDGQQASEDGDETESSDEIEGLSINNVQTSFNKMSNGVASRLGLESSLDTSTSSVESGEVIPEEEEEELDEAAYFQPLPAKQRVALLRQAGITPEIKVEKETCAEIRASRQICGCSCEGSCEPTVCDCALSGIRCQVDRAGFPCGCAAEGCKNPSGRIEFDPVRVRSHYLHTMLRLKMEQAGAWAGKTITPSRHVRFTFAEDGESSGSPSNAIPTSWDPSQGPALLSRHNLSTDSGIDSPPVTLATLYAHQSSRDDSRTTNGSTINGYHKVDAAQAHFV